MEKILHELWYNPKTGFTSAKVLHERAQKQDVNIKLKDVQNWLAKQRTAQLHKPARKGKSPGHILSFNPRQRVQADLIDMSKYPSIIPKTRKKGLWVLVVVDVFTRKLFARALPSKEVENVAPAFNDIVDEMGFPPENLDTDNGGEFGQTFDKKISQDIRHWRSPVGDHRSLGVVDATIRIFKNLIFRTITDENSTGQKQTYSWAKNLKDLVENYNNTTKEPLFDYSPNDIENDEKLQDLIRLSNQENMSDMIESKKNEPPFKVGDKVRIPTQKGPFKRGFKKQMSDKTYPITRVNAESVVVDVNGSPRRFLFSEVNESGIALDKDTFEVEEVTNKTRKIKRGKKNVTQYLVKFKGYNEPEWVDESDILSLS